jgi:hypothetical protein
MNAMNVDQADQLAAYQGAAVCEKCGDRVYDEHVSNDECVRRLDRRIGVLKGQLEVLQSKRNRLLPHP